MPTKKISQKPTSVDTYLDSFPERTQKVLRKLRGIIRKAAPGGEDAIAYRMAALKWQGRFLIYYAGFAEHVGLYPTPINHPELRADLAPYASGKATARFALDRPLPAELITRIVKIRQKLIEAKTAKKRK